MFLGDKLCLTHKITDRLMNEEPVRFGDVWQRRRNSTLLAEIAVQLQLLDEEHSPSVTIVVPRCVCA